MILFDLLRSVRGEEALIFGSTAVIYSNGRRLEPFQGLFLFSNLIIIHTVNELFIGRTCMIGFTLHFIIMWKVAGYAKIGQVRGLRVLKENALVSENLDESTYY